MRQFRKFNGSFKNNRLRFNIKFNCSNKYKIKIKMQFNLKKWLQDKEKVLS